MRRSMAVFLLLLGLSMNSALAGTTDQDLITAWVRKAYQNPLEISESQLHLGAVWTCRAHYSLRGIWGWNRFEPAIQWEKLDRGGFRNIFKVPNQTELEARRYQPETLIEGKSREVWRGWYFSPTSLLNNPETPIAFRSYETFRIVKGGYLISERSITGGDLARVNQAYEVFQKIREPGKPTQAYLAEPAIARDTSDAKHPHDEKKKLYSYLYQICRLQDLKDDPDSSSESSVNPMPTDDEAMFGFYLSDPQSAQSTLCPDGEKLVFRRRIRVFLGNGVYDELGSDWFEDANRVLHKGDRLHVKSSELSFLRQILSAGGSADPINGLEIDSVKTRAGCVTRNAK